MTNDQLMKRLEQHSPKVMKVTIACAALGNAAVGIAGIINGENYYFLGLSFWVIGAAIMMIYHGLPRHGWKVCLSIVVIGMVLSLFFESAGCNFGWFFSKYEYLGYIPGPKLFGFNVYSMVAYGIGMLLPYEFAEAAAGQYGKHTKSDIIAIPLIAALILVSIDLATDPLMATDAGAYVWEEHGVYNGIPFQNYLGWYLMAFCLYLPIEIIVYRQQHSANAPADPEMVHTKEYWSEAPLLYGTVWIQIPFYVFIGNNHEVVNGAGQTFMTTDIHQCVFIVYTAAIFLPCLMTYVNVRHSKELK